MPARESGVTPHLSATRIILSLFLPSSLGERALGRSGKKMFHAALTLRTKSVIGESSSACWEEGRERCWRRRRAKLTTSASDEASVMVMSLGEGGEEEEEEEGEDLRAATVVDLNVVWR